MSYFYVFLGGGLGSICRFALTKWLPNQEFPWATLAANALSCIVLGALLALSSKQILSPPQRLLLVTGFCGGFSTFSTFSNECLQFLKTGDYSSATLYILGSMLAGFAGLLVGMKLLE